ncbi:19062_t:CDS:2 [Gigaspora margarita]|uniref:19062_t:CDS:1 n=1 Tax=Gigaspora margarita TaxID=4874 RepID=A0ABN7VW67_GIGMA|nr:19062_t:CDS:2 [Gigaspora margarita]
MGEVDDDHIVIADPDNTPVLPLHDVITDDWYRNIDRQDEYEERYLHQRADRMYAHGYRRPQINDPIVASLEPGT